MDAADSLTKLVAAHRSYEDTMQRMADLAVHAVDAADECTISFASRSRKELRTLAATGDAGRRIDEIQKETGEGPCMSSIEDHATFRIEDMVNDDTWPRFSKQTAHDTGIHSMLTFVLRLSDDETGAMNMLARNTAAFSGEDEDTGTLFAAQVAIAISGALGHIQDEEKVGQLEKGLKTRQVIGAAVGILMATRGVDADEAFRILVKVSQNSNVKVRDIAAKIVKRTREV